MDELTLHTIKILNELKDNIDKWKSNELKDKELMDSINQAWEAFDEYTWLKER